MSITNSKVQIKYSNSIMKVLWKTFVLSLLGSNLFLYFWSLDESKEVMGYTGSHIENLSKTFDYYFFWAIAY